MNTGLTFTLRRRHPDKLQGWLPDYPGTPMIKEGKYTSHVIGNLKAFSSNELLGGISGFFANFPLGSF